MKSKAGVWTIKRPENAVGVQRGRPVVVMHSAGTEGQRISLISGGIFYSESRDGNKLSVIEPIATDGPFTIRKINYAWSGTCYVCLNTQRHLKPGSRTFRHYEGLLWQLAEAK